MAAAKTAAASSSGGRGGASSKVEGTVVPRGVKKPLNKQDLLKRIGSIENDEVSTSLYVVVEPNHLLVYIASWAWYIQLLIELEGALRTCLV